MQTTQTPVSLFTLLGTAHVHLNTGRRILPENEICFQKVKLAHDAKVINHSEYKELKMLASALPFDQFYPIAVEIAFKKYEHYVHLRLTLLTLRTNQRERNYLKRVGEYSRPYLP